MKKDLFFHPVFGMRYRNADTAPLEAGHQCLGIARECVSRSSRYEDLA
jgi:hypothetical protein